MCFIELLSMVLEWKEEQGRRGKGGTDIWTTVFEKLGQEVEYRGRAEGRKRIFPIRGTNMCLTTDGKWGGCRIQS